MTCQRFQQTQLFSLLLFFSSLLITGCGSVTSQGLNVEGVRLFQQAKYQDATDKFHQAIASSPQAADGYYNLAAVLHRTGTLLSRPNDLKQAESYYNQCLERSPDHADCYRGLAVLLTETGRQDSAFRLLENWNTAKPQLANPKIELARLLEETGYRAQAENRLVEALVADPYDSRVFGALGRLQDQAGQYQKAIVNYQRSLELNKHQPQVVARIAALQTATGTIRRVTPLDQQAPTAFTAQGATPRIRY